MSERKLLIGNRFIEVSIGINGVKIHNTPVPPANAAQAIRAAGVPVVNHLQRPRIGGSIGNPLLPEEGHVWGNSDDISLCNEHIQRLINAGLVRLV